MNHNLVCLLLLLSVYCTKGARILGIFPAPSISHQLPFQAIMKALAARGHQITVLSPNPLKAPVPNYKDVDLSFCYEHLHATFNFAKKGSSEYEFTEEVIPFLSNIAGLQLGSPQIQDFIRSNESKYDLVFLEALVFQSYHGLIHHLGSPPVIGVLSFESFWTSADAVGTPSNPAFIPDVLTPYGNHMTFYERVQNTLFWLWIRCMKLVDIENPCSLPPYNLKS